MPKILDRYSSAISTDDMTSDPMTVWADSDVLGAAGIAAKTHPIALGLTRMLMGDKRAAQDVATALAQRITSVAWKQHRQRLSPHVAREIAQATLAWSRYGRCGECDGTGYQKAAEAPIRLGICPRCGGTGKTRLEAHFEPQHRHLAEWAASEIDRRMHEAGPAAMQALAPKFAL